MTGVLPGLQTSRLKIVFNERTAHSTSRSNIEYLVRFLNKAVANFPVTVETVREAVDSTGYGLASKILNRFI